MDKRDAEKIAAAVDEQLAAFRRTMRREVDDAIAEAVGTAEGRLQKAYGAEGTTPRRGVDARALRDTAEAARMLGETVKALLGRVSDLEAAVAGLGKAGTGGLKVQHLEGLVDEIGAYVRRVVAANGMRYSGVYAHGKEYTRGQCVSHQGSVWHCNRATLDQPGTGSESWTLAVKSGQHRN